MSVKILYFAHLRETMGLGEESVEPPENITSISALKDWLIAQGREALGATPNLRYAVNQEMARANDPVLDGDEIAFFPPVTGG